MAAPENIHCNCKKRPPLIAGWEGTAIVPHGSLIKFGCLAFVFSVADFGDINEDDEDI